jgi:hypothetical protein
LGNQLFQHFIGHQEARLRRVAEIQLLTDFVGQYKSAREIELAPLLQLDGSPRDRLCKADRLAKLRLPKVLWRLRGCESILQLPGYGVLVDGYFQDPPAFLRYPQSERLQLVKLWRDRLLQTGHLERPDRGHVNHIRLGDFFKTLSEARAYARERLMRLEPGDVITDQEDLLHDELASLPPDRAMRVVPTGQLCAWDLMRLFSRYRSISTNGSSLAFWAAVLGRAEFQSSNSKHVEIWRQLSP